MFDQRTFHVERADPVAGGGDHVIAATDEADAAVRVPLDGVATQVVVADKGLGRPAFVAGEPAHRRLAAVDGQDAGLANAEFLVFVIEDRNAVARRGKTGGAHVNRVFKAMVVAQHHAQLGLAVVVVDDHAEVVGEPADHFRVQRLAGAADDAQLALDRPGELIAAGNQQTVGRRGAREVGNPVLVDHPAGTFEGERAIVKGDWMPHRHGPGDTVVNAVGPTRIGQVPEVVFGA
ncbi:hypothetical protein D9M73_180320 [compost metagenome]